MTHLINVPSLDGSKQLFLNTDRICSITPHRNDSEKCSVAFSLDHIIVVGCGEGVLAQAIEDKKHRVS